MSSRKRLAYALGAIVASVVVTACADKAFHPLLNGSPKIQLQFNAVGAQQVSASGKKQVLVAVAAYQSGDTLTSTSTGNDKSIRFLAGPVVVQVTGGSQTVTLNVDLTGCLADGTRQGSHTACSLYYGVWLHDSAGFSADSDFSKLAYDYSVVGPVDVVPGTAPVLPAITLSQSRFSVFTFTGDEALRLGGIQTPQNFTGPITGTVSGVATGSPAVLFGLTQGNVQLSTCTNSSSSGCVGTGYFAAQLAIFQNGTWRRVSAAQGIPQFNDVAAFSPTDVYLAGQNGVYHYDGSAISVVTGTTGENVLSVGAITSGSSKIVVAGTSAGNAWFGNNGTFTKSSVSATGGGIDAACATGPTEAFAMNSSSGTLYRFNGTSWTSAPSSFFGVKSDLQCPAPGVAFVTVAVAGVTSIISWNGSSFVAIPSPPRSGRLAVVSNSEIYVAADSGGALRSFYKYNGSSWSLIGTSQYLQPIVYRPWADPRGGAAYFHSSFGRVDQVTSAGAHPVSYNPSIRDAIMTSSNSAFVVGWNLFLARWNGATWTVDPPPTGTGTTRILAGVWSDGPSNAWAVGNAQTILHWDGSKWSTLSDNIHPVASLDNYNAVTGAAGNVWIAGGNSILHCRSITLCSTDPVSGIDTLYGIWAGSATNGWAVGAHGKILHYDGTQWTTATSPTAHRMVRVWGSGPSDVWAVGDSALVHYDGTSWTNATNTENNILNTTATPPAGSQFAPGIGLWSSGSRDVYFGSWSGQLYRYDGSPASSPQGAWTTMPSPNQNGGGGGRIVAISGAAGCGAIALVDEQTAFNSSNLLRGVGPSGCLGAPMSVTLPWP